MAELLRCLGPVGMLAECEHGQTREHYYLNGPCNACGTKVTVVFTGPDGRAEVKGFMCRECMQRRRYKFT
jgi:hypothetical protein